MGTPGQNEPEKAKATDMEMAVFHAKLLDNPGEVDVKPGESKNNREFHLREARRALSTMTESHARRFLELKIKEYEEPEEHKDAE